MQPMLNPVELFVGLRYLRAKRRTKFVSFITLISLIGIALGVAALIVILSVMNGFEGELRDRLLSMSAHGQIQAADGSIEDWEPLVESVSAEPGIESVAPFSQMEGMIQSGRELVAVLVHGVEPAYEKSLSGSLVNMLEGDLDVLQPGERSIILGAVLSSAALEVARNDGAAITFQTIAENANVNADDVVSVFDHLQVVEVRHTVAADVTGEANLLASFASADGD